MEKTLQIPLLSRIYHFGLSLIVLCLCVSGCASFSGKELPGYTYADLAPAPEKKLCLVISDTGAEVNREVLDATVAMLEKSGYFLKAPDRCTPNGDEIQNSMKMDFQNDLKAGNLVVAAVSGFVSGATLTIIPAYARDEYVMTVQLKRNDHLVKEYVYREHMDTWIHLSMLFMPNHTLRATIREIYGRMVMSFLYDYSRDVQQGRLMSIGQ